MTRRRPRADLGSQIADVQQGGKSIGGGTRGAQTPATPTAVDPRKPGRISVLEKQAFDNTSLSADLVLAKIQAAYVMGIRRCYRAYLQKDPSAKGELVLKLTVNHVGRAVDGKAVGVANEIRRLHDGADGVVAIPDPEGRQR